MLYSDIFVFPGALQLLAALARSILRQNFRIFQNPTQSELSASCLPVKT